MSGATHRHATMQAWLGTAVAVAAVIALGAAPSHAAAGGAPAVVAVAGAHARLVSPAQFLPQSDGQDDSAGISVDGLDAAQQGALTFDVVDAGGTVVQTVAPLAGTSQGWWDGTLPGGAVAKAGTYELRARVAGAPVAASAQGATRVHVLDARFIVDHLKVTRATVSAAQSTRAQAAFRMTRKGMVQAVVVDTGGDVVRTIASGHVRAGTSRLAWDGRTDANTPAADGRYRLLVAGSGGAMPSATLETPLLVDRHAPKLLPGKAGATATAAGKATMSVRVTETARIVVSVPGTRRRTQVIAKAGRSILSLSAASLGVRAGRSARSVPLRLVAIDTAGNRTAAKTVLHLAGTAPAPTKAPAATPAPAAPAPTTHPSGEGGTTAPDPAEGTPQAHSLAWPTHGIITSPFGPRGAGFHYGVDIAAASGTQITAAAAGLVSYAGTMDGYGNIVIVQHPGGISTRYAHLSKIDVVVGSPIPRGGDIGKMGCTGHCTGPHLHFEVRTSDVATNPIGWVPAGPPPAA